MVDGKVVLLCRQFDDVAVACSDPTVAQGSIDSIGKVVDPKSQGILNSQGLLSILPCTYAEFSCFRFIELLATSTAEELFTLVGPAEDSPEHRVLEKEMGFGYRKVLRELTYAYRVGRVDISYAVTLLY
jgi:hypothetical protein